MTGAAAVPSGGPPALEVRDLAYAWGATRALDGVSLDVPTGRFTGLVGPNGAGKTTLFSIVTGLFRAAAGTVRVRGHEIGRETGAALGALGVVFQQPTLDADLTVVQNLAYFASLHGIARREARARIEAGLERHGLEGLAKRRAGSLSGGQRRRVELARALLHGPSLLLMDEPTVGLDMPSRTGFVEHVHALAADEGVGVLWATHLVDEIRGDDLVHVLHRGRILGGGALDALVAEHGATDVAGLVDALAAADDGRAAAGAAPREAA